MRNIINFGPHLCHEKNFIGYMYSDMHVWFLPVNN